MSVHWVFDDPQQLRTMSACPRTTLGQGDHLVTGRFPIANLFHYWRNNWWNRSDWSWQHSGIADRPRRYAYNIGTWQDAKYWTGWPGNEQDFDCFLEHVPPQVMADARDGRVLLVIDNLNEGFYEPQLYDYLHQCCERYGLPPRVLCFVTGNELDPRGYAEWCDQHGIGARMHIIGFPHLLYMQQVNLRRDPAPTWADHVAAKRDRSQVKLYNCLNRVSRQHRELMVIKLIDADLHMQGLVSHNQLWYHGWDQWGVPAQLLQKARDTLPLIVDDADFGNNKAMHINAEIYLRTWFAVINETHAWDEPHNLFISEKLWKPIWALQPFMVWGQRHSMALLRRWGFETFGNLWDESYDDQADLARLDTIIQNITAVHFRRDKQQWWSQSRAICEHNQQQFLKHDWFNSEYYRRFMAAYQGLNS